MMFKMTSHIAFFKGKLWGQRSFLKVTGDRVAGIRNVDAVIPPRLRSSKGPTWEGSSISFLVSAAATMWPVPASLPTCSVRQDRRVLTPCFSILPAPAATPVDCLSPLLKEKGLRYGTMAQGGAKCGENGQAG